MGRSGAVGQVVDSCTASVLTFEGAGETMLGQLVPNPPVLLPQVEAVVLPQPPPLFFSAEEGLVQLDVAPPLPQPSPLSFAAEGVLAQLDEVPSLPQLPPRSFAREGALTQLDVAPPSPQPPPLFFSAEGALAQLDVAPPLPQPPPLSFAAEVLAQLDVVLPLPQPVVASVGLVETTLTQPVDNSAVLFPQLEAAVLPQPPPLFFAAEGELVQPEEGGFALHAPISSSLESSPNRLLVRMESASSSF